MNQHNQIDQLDNSNNLGQNSHKNEQTKKNIPPKKRLVIIALVTIIFFGSINYGAYRYLVSSFDNQTANEDYTSFKIESPFPSKTYSCDFFSFLDYELPDVTVKDVYNRAEKLGYVTSANLNRVETKTLEEVNKNAHSQMQIKEGDIEEHSHMTIVAKNGIVYFNYRDNIIIEKKIGYITLQMRLRDKYTGPTSERSRKVIDDSYTIQPVNIIKKNNDPALGDPNSPVIITIFVNFDLPYKQTGDYQRENYLDKINKLRSEYISKGKIYLIFKHFPLPGQENSMVASEAAQCAYKQGKFWEMHDIIFANQNNQSNLSYDSFLEWANYLKLDINEYKQCLNSGQTRDFIKKSCDESTLNYHISGTPSFFVNGKNLRNPDNYITLQYIINQELGVEKNYIKTMFDLGVLNACNGGYFTNLLKRLFIDLELNPNIVEGITLERNSMLGYPE